MGTRWEGRRARYVVLVPEITTCGMVEVLRTYNQSRQTCNDFEVAVLDDEALLGCLGASKYPAKNQGSDGVGVWAL
jgi:hypothetical protein